MYHPFYRMRISVFFFFVFFFFFFIFFFFFFVSLLLELPPSLTMIVEPLIPVQKL